MSILEVRQLSKVYGDKQAFQEVLKEINLDVDEGEFISIMGPSGSGKTTLLNVLSSIDYMTKGSITINGKQLEKLSNKQLSDIRKKDIGFIFQEYNLLHTLTVKENIMLPLSVQKFHKYEMEQNYKEVAEALGIYNLGNKYPSEISGGQQQRTAAARAFVHKPTIIFADEPTGALDSKSAQDLLHRLEDMNKQFNSTIMMVTHDPSAASYAERVIMLKDGDIHSEIYQGNDSKQTFYQEIMKLQTALGGVSHDI